MSQFLERLCEVDGLFCPSVKQWMFLVVRHYFLQAVEHVFANHKSLAGRELNGKMTDPEKKRPSEFSSVTS